MPATTNFVMSFCHWAEDSSFGAGVRNSSWLFPFVEIFHLLALGILGGTFLVLNLRLLGFLFRDTSVSELANEVKPWMYSSLGVMLVSGFFLFSSESVKMYSNPAFRIKMAALSIAILFSFTLYRNVTRSQASATSAIWPRFAAVISILLWSVVGLAGRAIGYVGR